MAASWMYVLVILSYIDNGNCGKVLLAVHQYRSHSFEMAQVGRGLRELGHDVYILAARPYSLETLMEGYGFHILYYHLPKNIHPPDSTEYEEWHTMKIVEQAPFMEFMDEVAAMAMDRCFYMMGDDKFLAQVKSHQFDIVIYDAFALSECMVILPYHIGIPYVYEFADYAWRLPVSKLTPAFNPSLFVEFSDQMNFWEKIENTFSHYLELVGPFAMDKNATLLDIYGHGAKSWTEVTSRSALFLISRDFLLEWPRATLPNMIHTSGLTQSVAQSLPPDLDSAIAASGNDVIVMSIGSIAQLELFPREIINNFFQAFSGMPEFMFICKFKHGDKTMKDVDVPKNVIVAQWIPQNDLLGHHKTRLYVTHGGNNGQHEAVYHGVPMINFPLFGEQFKNAFRVAHHKIGITMDMFRFTPDELVNNIRTVLDEQNDYIKNVKKLSLIMKSFPTKPRDTMAFWVDHVMQFGSEHLYSPSQQMSVMEIFMLDVLLVISIPLVLLFIILFCCYKQLKKYLFPVKSKLQ